MSLCKNLSRKCVRLAALVSLVAASALAAQAQVVFSPPKNISNSSGNTQAQQVAVDKNGNVNVVWADNSLGNYAIFFSRSSDTGATFSAPVSISKHAQSTASGPQVAVDPAGNIDVVWTETSPDGSANFIYFAHSTDGVTFTNPQNISGDAGMATSPQIAVDSGGGVDVVWVDTSLGNSEIFFSRSTDGATFSAPLNVSNDSGTSSGPKIAVDPAGNINVGWSDNTPGEQFDVFFSRSTDGGATFSAPLQVTKNTEYNFAQGLSQIAAGENGSIYLVWTTFTCCSLTFPSHVVLSRSTDGGKTFAPAGGLTSTFGLAAVDPSGDNIGIVGEFNEDTPQPFVEAEFSANAGGSFSGGGGGIFGPFTNNPNIAVDAIGRFDITYTFPGGFSPGGGGYRSACLCFAQTADGSSFSSENITSYAPFGPVTMAVDGGGNVSVVWLQSPSGGGSASVFFSRGTVPPFSLGVSPAAVVEGSSSMGTVKLVAPAPAGGAVISLSSSNSSAANVPASVTVAEGASSATFAIVANPVPTRTSTTITASLNGSTNTAFLAVNTFFEVGVSDVTGGNTAFGDVFSSQPAPSGGLVITLSSSDSSVASVPVSVTIPAGSRFASFSVPTSPVATSTIVQITGTGNGFTHSTSFTVQPARLQQLSVSPTTAINASGSTGTVTLTGPAGAGGAVVSLSSRDPSASVPASVTIPAGATSASFTITTNPGSSTTAINVTISASYNGVTLNASLTVQPLFLQQVTVSAPAVGGGSTVNGDVRLNVAAPAGGVVVSFSSSNPSLASVPASVTIPEGSLSLLQLFSINTSPVSADTTVTISASFNGVTRTTTITLQPITIAFLVAFDLQGGQSPNNYAVVLNGPATSPVVVSLTSSNPSLLSVPATVTIPQGTNGQSFSATSSPVTTLTYVTVTATYNGVTLSRTIGLHP